MKVINKCQCELLAVLDEIQTNSLSGPEGVGAFLVEEGAVKLPAPERVRTLQISICLRGRRCAV